ncbi:hypothetical protein ACFLX2_01275 [Candidatus Dependentiae bacterium]
MNRKIKLIAILLTLIPIIAILNHYQTDRLKKSTETFASYLKQSTDLTGKTIWVRAEWNLGDTMQFMRYVKKLHEIGAKIVLEPQKPLTNILSCCPYIDTVMEKGTLARTADRVSYLCPCLGALLPEPKPNQHIDFTVSLARLPAIFDDLPKKIWQDEINPSSAYLHADPNLVRHWQKKLQDDKNVKVGICWFGDSRHNPERFIPLRQLATLAQISGVTLYSLQKNHGLEQLEQLPEKLTVRTFDDDFDKKHGSFMDTAAIMKNLDLIITVDTSVAHLAGGLGVPTWTLLPHEPEWRWQKAHDSAWRPNYPSMKLFVQSQPGDWQSVVNDITNLLQQKLHGKELCA